MSTSNLLNSQFDESDDEDDFNPAPADVSDAEDAGGSDNDDVGAQIRNEASKGRVKYDRGPDEERTTSKRRSIADEEDGGEDVDEEDAEGDGDDTAPGADDDDEDEDEDDEEEITVSLWTSFAAYQKKLIMFNFLSSILIYSRVTAENVDVNAAINSSMSKPKLMRMKTKMRMTKTKSMSLRITLLLIRIPMTWQIFQPVERLTIGGTGSWIDDARWKQVLTQRSKQKS